MAPIQSRRLHGHARPLAGPVAILVVALWKRRNYARCAGPDRVSVSKSEGGVLPAEGPPGPPTYAVRGGFHLHNETFLCPALRFEPLRPR